MIGFSVDGQYRNTDLSSIGALRAFLKPRNVILVMTYGVVIFSLLVQGMTIGKVIEHVLRSKAGERERPT